MREAVKDTVEVVGVNVATFYAIGLDIELALKIILAAGSIAFLAYKWVKEAKRP